MQTTDRHARKQREARMRFYAELNDFLPEHRRQREFIYSFSGTPSVCGTPIASIASFTDGVPTKL